MLRLAVSAQVRSTDVTSPRQKGSPNDAFFTTALFPFITGTLSFLTCIWQAVTNSLEHLFVARFVLGLGIGPKSATVPVYAAECAPPNIRGALVMMW